MNKKIMPRTWMKWLTENMLVENQEEKINTVIAALSDTSTNFTEVGKKIAYAIDPVASMALTATKAGSRCRKTWTSYSTTGSSISTYLHGGSAVCSSTAFALQGVSKYLGGPTNKAALPFWGTAIFLSSVADKSETLGDALTSIVL